jgi:hypothetical protein
MSVEVSWQTHPSPKGQRPGKSRNTFWKSYMGESCPHGLSLVLVNGTYVRDHHDSDFSQGGNGYRYRFVPKGEIWIDCEIDPDEWPLIAFHECQEAWHMKHLGWSYDRAHDAAKKLEGHFRAARRNR